MTAATIGLVSTVLAIAFGLALVGLVVWLVVAARGRPQMLAMLGLACALFGRFISMTLTFFLHSYGAIAVSFVLQTLLSIASYALLVYAVIVAVRGRGDDDLGTPGSSRSGDYVQLFPPNGPGDDRRTR